MANARALTLQSGRYTQVQDGDVLQVGLGIDRATAGALAIGSSVATALDLGGATCPISVVGKVDTDVVFDDAAGRVIRLTDGANLANPLTVRTGTSAAGATGTLSMQSGNATAGASGTVTVASGTTTTSGASGLITVVSGNSVGNSGDVRVDVGTAGGTLGTLLLGDSNATAITLGSGGTTTTVAGTLAVTTLSTANLELTNTAGVHYLRIAAGNAASSLEVYSANTTAAASGALTLKSGNAIGGASGTVGIISGTSSSAASGGININVGAGTTNGSIGIGNGAAAPAAITVGQATTPLGVDSVATFSAVGTALTVNNNALVTGTLTNTGGIFANGANGVDRTTGATLTIAGTNATQVDIAPAANAACTIVNLGNGAAMTTASLFTGAAMTTINLGTSMGAGDAINIGGVGCDVNINGNLDVIGTSEFDQNVVIGDGVGGPDTLSFHNAADPNGGYLGSVAMPDVRFLYESPHQLYVANSSTAATAGGALTIAAGKAKTTGTGGLMTVKGGAGDTATSTGGGLDLYSGAGGATSGDSGAVNLKSGSSTTGTSGAVTIDAGTFSVAGGAITIGGISANALDLGRTTKLVRTMGNTQIGQAGTDTMSVYPYYENHMAYTNFASPLGGTFACAGVTVNDAIDPVGGVNPTAVTLLGHAGGASPAATAGLAMVRGGDGGSNGSFGGPVAVFGGAGAAAGAATPGGKSGALLLFVQAAGAGLAAQPGGNSDGVFMYGGDGGAGTATGGGVAGAGGKVEIKGGDAGADGGAGGATGGNATLDGGDSTGAAALSSVEIGAAKAGTVQLGRTSQNVTINSTYLRFKGSSTARSYYVAGALTTYSVMGATCNSSIEGGNPTLVAVQGWDGVAGSSTHAAVLGGTSSTATQAGGFGAVFGGKGNTSGVGGAAILQAGEGGATATGGGALVSGGYGGATSGNGGDAVMQGGNAVAGGGSGGSITIKGGLKNGAGTDGSVNISTISVNRLVFTGTTITVQTTATLGCTGAGSINLPNNTGASSVFFQIGGTAVGATGGANITALNFNKLFDGSNADTLHIHAAGTATRIDVAVTATDTLLKGGTVSMSVNGTAYKALMATDTEKANVVGLAPAAGTGSTAIAVSGEVTTDDSTWDAIPVQADVGKRVYASTTAGKITLTPPTGSGNVQQKVGVISYAPAVVSTPPNVVRVVVQIGEGVTQ